MRIVKIVFAALLLLAMALVLVWGTFYYLIWPKPEIVGLVPGAPMAYIAASNLSDILPAVRESDFAARVMRSSLWESLRSSGLWRQMGKRRQMWERQMKVEIEPKMILQLVQKDALLALYREQGKWDFLLISEVGLLTRINVTSGSTKRALASQYEFATEKYRGVDLVTVAVPGRSFSYGFIGRAGLLSTDTSLLKKAIDVHRGSGLGLTTTPEFRELVAGFPLSGVSFYVDAAEISKGTPVLRSAHLGHLTPVAQGISKWACVGSSHNGNLRIDQSIISIRNEASSNRPPDSVGLTDNGLAVPANCMAFMLHEGMKPDFLLKLLEAGAQYAAPVSIPGLEVVRDRLLPVLHGGVALAILEPNVKEYQLLPPVALFFKVKDGKLAQTALKEIEGSSETGGGQLEFTEIKHENIPINYTRLPIGMGMSLDAGYTLIGNDLLVVATDKSALKAAVDVSLGKRQSLMTDEHYASVLAPIAEAAEGRAFVNVKSAAAIIKQAAKLYALRAMVAGESEAERVATMLYQNAFIMEAWHGMGAAFGSDSGRAHLKLVLDAGY